MGLQMLVGLDFDNTIACYDTVFKTIIDDMNIVPPDTGPNKTAIRDYLRNADREHEWTELQGYIYGAGMAHATPFPGVLDFIDACQESGIDVCVISHRTKYPYAGPRVDLHAAAREWLEVHAIVSGQKNRLSHDVIRFELTKADKLACIETQSCHWFVDDLPEFLTEEMFPKTTQPILFDPEEMHSNHSGHNKFHIIKSWSGIQTHIMSEAKTG
jgi:hypothetical protein